MNNRGLSARGVCLLSETAEQTISLRFLKKRFFMQDFHMTKNIVCGLK